MRLGWVIAGNVLQLCYALLAFMAVVFSSASLVNTQSLTPMQHFILDNALHVLPLVSLVIIVLTSALYFADAAARWYWLHAIPILLGIAYISYAVGLN
ncbi:hypothetical protein Q7C_1494 [Methylophaga frappieri]|uniref:Uncharacterized protein n=1 Tax=Methylophaga frappieri (strain ATCC BAA-2434 / DSM 25690 / JAM7) TaxID=754477 RepID=I1YIA0_METFJ|nr:hypothetical protein [Methylophaga frappieri]AFJ02643.1 hypothetical protein Q7C_1494 [Methylophaga frappieri]